MDHHKRSTKLEEVKEQFGNSIKFTTEGKRHLGAVIGSQIFKEEYVNDKVEKWCQEIERLHEISRNTTSCCLCCVHLRATT